MPKSSSTIIIDLWSLSVKLTCFVKQLVDNDGHCSFLEESKPNNNLDCQQKSAEGKKLGEEEEHKR
jgi:hypothetical protein